MHVKHGLQQKALTTDRQYLKVKHSETFSANYTIQNKEHSMEGKMMTYITCMTNPIFYNK